jgi:DNA-binding IclR family transcriptional regulator
MSKRTALAVVVALVGLCGLALAQQVQPPVPRTEDPVGRFTVSGSGDQAFLLDTATGRTWTAHRSAEDRGVVWLPARRVDDPDEAAKWLTEQAALKRELAKRRVESGQ